VRNKTGNLERPGGSAGCAGGIGGLFSPRRTVVDRGPNSTFTSDEWKPQGDGGCSLQPHRLADRCADYARTPAKLRIRVKWLARARAIWLTWRLTLSKTLYCLPFSLPPSVKQALDTGHDSGRAHRNAGRALAGTRRRARRRRLNAASWYAGTMDASPWAAYYPQSRELGQPIPFARSGKGDKPL